jgi:hypothetical protein
MADQIGVDIGFLLETKLTGGIHTCFSSGYEVFALMATLVRQGGIALFWRGNNSYEVEEMQNRGPNIIPLHLMIGNVRFYIIGCYIPPSNLATLMNIDKAWHVFSTGAHPIVVSNLNINLCAQCAEREETIAKQVNTKDLVNFSRHFYQHLGTRLWGRWTWRMRREGRWVSSQCDYFLGREIDCRRFQCISVQMPPYYSPIMRWLLSFMLRRGGEGGGIKAIPAMDPAISPLPPLRPTEAAQP